MKTAYPVLLLASLLGTATSLLKKKYIFVDRWLSWVDAQTYCRTHYTDLATFESKGDITSFMNTMHVYITQTSWIGLSKPPNTSQFTQWSDGAPVDTTNWAIYESGAYDCVAIVNVDSEWGTITCSEPFAFFCYKWKPQIILVKELKTWDQALRYCQENYTDLISLTTKKDFSLINNALINQKTSVWTGLRFIDGLWFWVDGEPLPSLVDLPLCPAPSFRCGALDPGTEVLENRHCMEKRNFVCY